MTGMIRKKWANGMKILSVALGAGFLFSAPMAFGAANTAGLVNITLRGVGTGALALGDCASVSCSSPGTCSCFTGAESVVGKPFNGGSLTFTISVESSLTSLPLGSASAFCQPAGGAGKIAGANGKNTAIVSISGFACPTIDGLFETFNGTYAVTPGGSKYTHGTGALNGSVPAGGTDVRVSLVGNVQP